MLFGSDWNANYHAFGEVAEQSGSEAENKYGFTGKEHDSGTGLRYYGWRYYDPQLGRWLTIDPAGQGWSPYAYGGNRPVMMVDSDGRWFVAALVALGAISGGVTGAQIAEAKGANGLDHLQYVLLGAAIGGISAYVGAAAAPGAGGVISGGVSTFMNSLGMNMLSDGQIGVYSQLGPLNISEAGFKLANPFKDRGALRSAMGWLVLGGDLFSLYAHYREKQGPYSDLDKDVVEDLIADSYDPSRGAEFPHEEGAWLDSNGNVVERFDHRTADSHSIAGGPRPSGAHTSIHTHPSVTAGNAASPRDFLTGMADDLNYGYVVTPYRNSAAVFYPIEYADRAVEIAAGTLKPLSYHARTLDIWLRPFWLYRRLAGLKPF